MQKKIYLINGTADESYKQFSDRILALAKTVSNHKEIIQLKVVFTKQAPPKVAVIPFKKGKIAAISISSIKMEVCKLLIDEPGFLGGYFVEEAIPVAYERTWKNGETTPGICLLTLFRQKKGIDQTTFINRWHKGHTPLSLKIHPLWHYNRNEVKEKLIENSYEWDGIVEEHTRTTSELLNPLKFFGNAFTMFYNMIRVYFDTKSFLDYKTIEPYLTTEIHVKS